MRNLEALSIIVASYDLILIFFKYKLIFLKKLFNAILRVKKSKKMKI